jgi:hypothetical protein
MEKTKIRKPFIENCYSSKKEKKEKNREGSLQICESWPFEWGCS